MLRTLWMTQNYTPFHIRLQLAKSYLPPTFLYGCEIFINPDKKSWTSMEKLHNNIARYVFKKRKYDHISQYAKQIFGMTLRNLLDFRGLVLLHKILNYKTPNYLYNKLTLSRSGRSRFLIQHRFSYSCSEHQYFVYAVRLWNSLPIGLRQIGNVEQFRKNLLSFYDV